MKTKKRIIKEQKIEIEQLRSSLDSTIMRKYIDDTFNRLSKRIDYLECKIKDNK